MCEIKYARVQGKLELERHICTQMPAPTAKPRSLLLAQNKLCGIQAYMLAALKNDTIRAAIRAKAIVASLIYVPTLDCLQQLEASPEGADALAILTEWQEFRSPDFEAIRASLAQPVIFDGRNLFDPQLMADSGIEYYGIGRSLQARAQ